MMTVKIVEYDLLTASDPDKLVEMVDEVLDRNENWQPLGGVAVSLSESDDYQYIIYAQAMVRIAE